MPTLPSGGQDRPRRRTQKPMRYRDFRGLLRKRFFSHSVHNIIRYVFCFFCFRWFVVVLCYDSRSDIHLIENTSSDLFCDPNQTSPKTRSAAAQKTCSQKAMHAEWARMRIGSNMTSSL